MSLIHVRACVVALTIASSGVAAADSPVDFNRQIRPLLYGSCINCHGPDEEQRAAELRLDTEAGSQADLGGYAAVAPGNPADSELVLRLTTDDEDLRMPPEGKGHRLTPDEIALVRRWISEGGHYARHWSYEPPVRHDPPQVQQADWAKNPIDHFVLAQLETGGGHPSPEADRLTLARRAALDLTGLPPTWAQAQEFLNDEDSGAYERYIDRLLAMPAFGERWARVWLDLARYADSAGYADDRPRTIWGYRDYVIRSLNENKPFDQFTIEQIAGDLLDNPTDQQLIATAFHRNTMTNSEGGTNDEEFRNEAIVDRVNTTMAVWMGTTMACAQCHTHKYDPITQEEYFQFYAFFNQTEDADRANESPLLDVWTETQKQRKTELQSLIESQKRELSLPNAEVDSEFANWVASWGKSRDWQPLPVSKATANNRILSVDQDGWIRGDDSQPDNDVYTLSIPTDRTDVSALRIETGAEQKNNFVVTSIRATWNPSPSNQAIARRVRIDLPGKGRWLHLAEVEVFSGGKNIAVSGTATQSSVAYNRAAALAIDGNPDTDFHKGSVTHTEREDNPWLEIDLGSNQPIEQIVVWNRTDGGAAIVDRLKGFQLKLLDDKGNIVWSAQPEKVANPSAELSVDGARPIKFISATADFQQSGFPAEATISEKVSSKTGWAIAGATGKPHAINLVLEHREVFDAGTLTLHVDQESIHRKHLVDQFRVSYTPDPKTIAWASLPKNTRELLSLAPDGRSEEQTQQLKTYHREVTPILAPQRNELAKLEKELREMKPGTTVPIYRAVADNKRRTTKIQLRGSYLNTGDEVSEATPTAFHPLDTDERPDRLDLARWLVDDDNPLTARVIANRHWEELFGLGIVETSDEFGSQGELPTHPKLLDWLAIELQESGWDIKALVKLLATSATYRQSSIVNAEMLEADPRNQAYARGPRFRISAEMVRDQALFVSGLLSDKMFGPPVKPPQPKMGLTAAFGGATDWETSPGSDRHRRGIYTMWRRSNPYPSMAQFDAPNRDTCTVRRIRTNTPLQALVTMNDPVYVEAAQSLARYLIESSDTDEGRIQVAMRRALIRDPSEVETQRLKQLVSDMTKHYTANPEAAMKIATDPIGKLPEGADAVEHAAWTVAANVILNLDEFLLKR